MTEYILEVVVADQCSEFVERKYIEEHLEEQD